MTADEFVAQIERVVYRAAVEAKVARLRDGPAGRDPSRRSRALHEWYDALGRDDQQIVSEVVRDASRAAVFQFFCVLDGVVAIDDAPHAELRVTAVDSEGRHVVIQDPSLEDLHDKFNFLVHPLSEDWPTGGSGS